MKDAVTKVIDTLTQEDFHGTFQKLLERYNKCIAAGGDYFEGDYSFMCVQSIKEPIRKKSLETYRMHLVYSIKLIFLLFYEFFHTSLSMECEWQQVSSNLPDSSQYFCGS